MGDPTPADVAQAIKAAQTATDYAAHTRTVADMGRLSPDAEAAALRVAAGMLEESAGVLRAWAGRMDGGGEGG